MKRLDRFKDGASRGYQQCTWLKHSTNSTWQQQLISIGLKHSDKTLSSQFFCYTSGNNCENLPDYLRGKIMKIIGVRIPLDLKEKLQKIADSQHRPLSNLIRLILIEWLERYEKKTKKST